MIQQILPPAVAVADTTADLLDSPVFPEEEPYLADSVEHRRREFVTTRRCARTPSGCRGRRRGGGAACTRSRASCTR